MVIVLASILASFAISRFPDSQPFTSVILKNQIMAMLMQSQQTALSHSSAANHTQLSVSLSGADWIMEISDGVDVIYTASLAREGENIYYSSINAVGVCDSLTNASVTPMVIAFDGNADLTPANKFRICIDSTPVTDLCISPAGYAYESTCL